MGLSSVGGDILWSNNARAIPGIELASIVPIELSNVISMEGVLGHYLLNDDREIDKARLHHKQLTLNFKTYERSVLSLGVHHYALWGGVSSNGTAQPNSIKDYVKIALGVARGNTAYHLGSYQLKYHYTFRNRDALQVYHQTIFENTDGMKLKNFPNGVWGAFWSTAEEDSFIMGVLYEYQHTLGPNNFFNNNRYASGYTYFDEVIGTPFITPTRDGTGIINNSYRAHHIGVIGQLFNLDYRGKASYVTNNGLVADPYDPSHNNLYVYGELIYNPSERSRFLFSLGGDLNTPLRDRITVSLGYRYRFGRLSRYIYARCSPYRGR